MFDLDRWLKRVWMVNGALFLCLLVYFLGYEAVSRIARALRSDDVVVAPETTPSATAKPRAVRYSPPRAIWGTKSRVVVVRYGKGQQGAGFESGARLSSSDYYSYGDGDADGPVVNLVFLTGASPGRVLLDKPAYVGWFDYPSSKDDSLQRWLSYRIAFEDTNGDGRLDTDDREDLYVSDLDGSNLRRVLPPGMRLLHHEDVGDGRRLVVTALEVPRDWRGSDDELPQRAFLYDVATGTTTPYTALDSLVRAAARILARP